MPDVMQVSDQAPAAKDNSGVHMKNEYANMADEISDLKQSLESFEQE